MATVSTHMHDKPYQVASTTDASLPHRKWKHHGTTYAVSQRSAAYAVYQGTGDIVQTSAHEKGIVFLFSCGVSICVVL